MGDIPVDAQHVVAELRQATRRQGAAPRSWVPSQSFEDTLSDASPPPVHLNQHLGWMHANWDLSALLAPPEGRGPKALVRRLQHRLAMAVLGPYLARLQDYLGVNVRALDTVSRRVDDLSANQLRVLGALRHDLVDFAHHVDEALDG